jgi:TRAP-type C4-dicarboxylate transport system permease small subunit
METQASARQVGGSSKFIQKLDIYATNISKWFNWIAGGGLVAMLLLVVGDIIGIKILAAPIPGGIELVAFLGVVVVGFAIAYTQVLHGHIKVDFIVMKFPPRLAAVVDLLMLILGMGFFVVLTWRSFDYARVVQVSGEVSMTQGIPFYPFIYGLSLCYLVTFFVLLVEFLKSIVRVGKVWNR